MPLPSHGTAVAYAALFLALCGSGAAATAVITAGRGAVKVRCSATRAGKRVSCQVVGTTGPGPRGPQGPQGPRGATGATGAQGSPGKGAGAGPTTLTQPPSYTIDANNTIGFLNQFVFPPKLYGEEEYSVAENNGSSTLNGTLDDVDMTLLSPSTLSGSPMHVASVQFCVNISPQTNPAHPPTYDNVSVVKATVYQLDEPTPAPGTPGDSSGPPAYSPEKVLLAQSYAPQPTTNDCLTASTSTPQAIDPTGYLMLAVTLSMTSPNNAGGPPTNYVQFGRVTTTYTP